ncbi:hypothetical protein I3760_05G018000 [Carya illinoinensis]|nr:hypothetical protein I3760_05G018000 [Carya illinoinensis]
MSRREGRDSDSRRHRSRFDREPSPKRSRRDGKPETERVPSNTDLDVGHRIDRDQKHSRQLQDALPLEAPTAPDSKQENRVVSKDSDKKAIHREGPKHSSDPTNVTQSRSYFQHDERGTLKVSRSIDRRATGERGWRDSKDQHDERAANKITYNTQRRDEKLQSKQDDNSIWRHDRFLKHDDPPPPAKKRPAFREKKISVDSENADKAEMKTVKSSNVDHSVEGSGRREERGRNHLDRLEKPSAGDRLPPKRGEAHRDGFLSRERFGVSGNYRGRDGISGRQGYRSSGTRVEKWKHDLYNPSRSPPPKNEDDQIAKLEALLTS